MILYKKINLYLLFIFIFSLLINQFSGNRGVFPIDSFAFFDTGFRVLNGEFPFKDFWVVSGPFIDYSQALFFYIFGVNWQSYLLNASLINALFASFTFLFFREFDLNTKVNFIFTLCLSILAYPSSGTLFVDHHSSYLSLMSVYSFCLALKKDYFIYWFLTPIFLCFAFFSKQVPSTYIFIFLLFVLFCHFFTNRKKNNLSILIKISLSLTFLLIFFALIKELSDINFEDFLDQYLIYPLTIGENRFTSLTLGLKNVVFDFKFIHLAFLPYFILNIFEIFFKKKSYKTIDFKIFLMFVFTYLSLIFHQLVTKNQYFIFFLIPIFTSWSYIFLQKHNFKWKTSLSYLLIFLCIFSTIKYFERFVIDRKFHELVNVDFKNSLKAEKIDNKFIGLKWITPKSFNIDLTNNEIKKIINIKKVLNSDERKKMVITNYSFYSVLLSKSISAPSRWYPMDGTGFPIKGNKYYEKYKKFFINIIKSKKIRVIYLLDDAAKEALLDYLDIDCLKKEHNTSNLLIYTLNAKCSDLDSEL